MNFDFIPLDEEALQELGFEAVPHVSVKEDITSETDRLKTADTDDNRGFKSPHIQNEAGVDGDESQLLAPPEETFTPIDLPTPAHVLAFFDPAFNAQKVILHPWQVEISDELGGAKPTQLAPLRYCLCAANGSGKDAYVIAPFAVWFIITKIKSRVVITSSSGQQLTAQTETYIRNMAQKVNVWAEAVLGAPIMKINQRHITCTRTGSEIRMYATDEPGKAEGYHPIEHDSEFAIIINEAKSIPQAIFEAITRCTGYNYWLEVSTPGEPLGHFYYAFTKWEELGFGKCRRVTAFDCPHLGDEYIRNLKHEYGEHSALYRSMVLALFTSVGGNVVIKMELIEEMLQTPPPARNQSWPLRIGIDIAAGGDENSVTITKGNRKVYHEAWREFDTTITKDRLIKIFQKFRISKEHEYIFMDDGNVGHSVADMLIRDGWNIRRVINQSTAVNKREFSNRAAENWYRVARLAEEGILDLREEDGSIDKTFVEQLGHRYYKTPLNSARITLESKKEAKANGHPSPDRADSYILSLFGVTLDDFLEAPPDETVKTAFGVLDKSKAVHELLLQEHIDETQTYAPYKETPLKGERLKVMSLSDLMKQQENESMFN